MFTSFTVAAFCLGRTVTTTHIITEELPPGYYCCNNPFLSLLYCTSPLSHHATSQLSTKTQLRGCIIYRGLSHRGAVNPNSLMLRGLNHETLFSYVWGRRRWLQEKLCAATFPQWEREMFPSQQSHHSHPSFFFKSKYFYDASWHLAVSARISGSFGLNKYSTNASFDFFLFFFFLQFHNIQVKPGKESDLVLWFGKQWLTAGNTHTHTPDLP